MSARTYICVACRWARRAETAHGLHTELRCPSCQGSLWELDKRWRIPRKTNDKEWAELAAKVSQDEAEWLPRRRLLGVAEMAKIDSQIAHLEKQSDSNKKFLKLKLLRAKRDWVSERYRVNQ